VTSGMKITSTLDETMSHDPTGYWRKRTLRIIKDLEEALIECAKLDLLEDVDEALDKSLKSFSEDGSLVLERFSVNASLK